MKRDRRHRKDIAPPVRLEMTPQPVPAGGREMWVLALIAFVYALRYTWNLPFYWEDHDYLVAARQGIDWWGLLRMRAGFYYRPLEITLFTGLHTLFGANALPYRIFKALALSGFLSVAVLLLRRLSGNRPAAAAAGMLLLLAPATMKSVMQFHDFEVVAGLMAVWGVYLFIKGRQEGGERFPLAAVLLLSAASLTRESARLAPLLLVAWLFIYEGRESLYRNWKAPAVPLAVAAWPSLFIVGSLLEGARLSRLATFGGQAFVTLTPWLLLPGVILLLLRSGRFSALPVRLPGYTEQEGKAVRFLLVWALAVWLLLALAPSTAPRYLLTLYLPLAGLVSLALPPGGIGLRPVHRDRRTWIAPAAAIIIFLPTLFHAGADRRLTGTTLAPYVQGLDEVMRYADKGGLQGRRLFYQSSRQELYPGRRGERYILLPLNADLEDALRRSGAAEGDYYLTVTEPARSRELAPSEQKALRHSDASHVRQFASGRYLFHLYRLGSIPEEE